MLDDAIDDVYFWLSWTSWKHCTSLRDNRNGHILLISSIEAARFFTINSFRLLAKQLRQSLAQDKARYLDKIVLTAGQHCGSDIFKALRPLRIGSALRKKGMRALPYLLGPDGKAAEDEDARDRIWSDHCAVMEAGVETTTQRLLKRVQKRTDHNFFQLPESLRLEDVPSLVELEGCFRRIKPRKAAGADGFQSDICRLASSQLARRFHPVLTKMYLRGEEPVQLKGGLLVSAFKSGFCQDVTNYRSLLLSSHLGKALRRTLRQRLVPYCSEASDDFHLSVKPGGCVSHASQGLRLVISAARSRGLSTGVLFLDVKAAYYRVVRELVVDMADDGKSLQRMLQYFNLDCTEEAELLAAVADGNVAEALNIPQHLQHLLREALCNTWFVTARRNTLHECLAGSRPGDGLADVVFALIFRKILQCVKDFCSEYGDFTATNSPQFDVFVDEPPTVDVPALLDVVWADDLAIVVTHRQPEEMLARIRFITSRTFRHCLRHALIPNLKRGKTELLLFIRGSGSRALRGHIFNQPDPFLDIDNVPQEFSRVVVSLCYKHLGSRIQLGRSILPETKARLGAATQIYRKHRRAIFQNKLLTLDRRKYLFTTMVMSIVKYNTGTWAELSKAESKFFVSRIMTMYRGLLRATVPEDTLRYWNNSLVLASLGLADPMQLLHEARLSFVVSAFKSGPQLLWTLAAAEGLWLKSVRDSRDWLHRQLKGLGPDKLGAQWDPNYVQVCRAQPDVFKRWIKKAAFHARLQHELVTKWKEWHHEFLLLIIQHGYQIAFPWPSGATVGDEISGEACLQCDRIFKNRAAWSVHAFKVHHRTNDRRYLINGTRCEACMREFGSMDKLQRHLTYKTSCAVQLRQAGHFYPIQPGINSTQQRKQMSYPIPVMSTQGPQRQWDQPVATEWPDGVLPDFEEELLDCALAITNERSFMEMVDSFKQVFRRQWYALTDLFCTFRHFHQEMLRLWEDLREPYNISITLLADVLQWVESRLHLKWFFSEERCALLPDAEALRSAAWNYCCERSALQERTEWQGGEPVPRFVHKELVFLHLFSGEKGDGDLQDALNEISIPSGCVRVILAVDIIYDAINADLSSEQIQARWMDFIRRGYIATSQLCTRGLLAKAGAVVAKEEEFLSMNQGTAVLGWSDWQIVPMALSRSRSGRSSSSCWRTRCFYLPSRPFSQWFFVDASQ